MATHFSEHYAAASSATVAPPTALPNVAVKAAVGLQSGEVHSTRAFLHFDVASLVTLDLIRVFPMKSGDRIIEMWISNHADWGGDATVAINMGIYQGGGNHDGPVIDGDLFINALDLRSTLARTDAYTEAILTDYHRGMPLWEAAALGEGTDTVDPQLEYDVTILFSFSGTITGTKDLLIECLYIPGGKS